MFIGVDPDTKKTAIALIDKDEQVVDLTIITAKSLHGTLSALPDKLAEFLEKDSRYGQIERAVVEGQVIHYRFTKNPDSIVKVAQVAGACASILTVLLPEVTTVAIPPPNRWKGDVPKEIHQGRILRRLNWPYERKTGYCAPTGGPLFDRFGLTEWKHLVDAIGLALWIKDNATQRQKKKKKKGAPSGS